MTIHETHPGRFGLGKKTERVQPITVYEGVARLYIGRGLMKLVYHAMVNAEVQDEDHIHVVLSTAGQPSLADTNVNEVMLTGEEIDSLYLTDKQGKHTFKWTPTSANPQ